MESLTSPMLAAGLLTVVNFHWLFSGTAIGFLASAALVVSSGLPKAVAAVRREDGVYVRLTRGLRIYLQTSPLRGLLAVTLSAAAAIPMVIVNAVVMLVGLGRRKPAVAIRKSGVLVKRGS